MLALAYSPESAAAFVHLVRQLNYIFSVFFVLEVVLKLAVMGPVEYSRDGYNVFDFAVTCLGLIEMIVEVGTLGTTLIILEYVAFQAWLG